jgi:hypothetical protein
MKLFKHFKNRSEFDAFIKTIDPNIAVKDELVLPDPLFAEVEIDIRFWSIREMAGVANALMKYMGIEKEADSDEN